MKGDSDREVKSMQQQRIHKSGNFLVKGLMRLFAGWQCSLEEFIDRWPPLEWHERK
jgi:hypothetical protein